MWARDLTLDVGSRSNTASKNKSIVRGLAYHRKVYRLLENWQKISAPEQVVFIEPWLRLVNPNEKGKRACCQPDAVVVDPASNTAIVIEVKLNWKDGRDEKLLNLYLDAVKAAFDLDHVWPALITSNIRGYEHQPRLGLGSLLKCDNWEPGDPTPVILVP
jgi:hypothetical protein